MSSQDKITGQSIWDQRGRRQSTGPAEMGAYRSIEILLRNDFTFRDLEYANLF